MTKEDIEDCWQSIRGIVWEGRVPDDAMVDIAFEMLMDLRCCGLHRKTNH